MYAVALSKHRNISANVVRWFYSGHWLRSDDANTYAGVPLTINKQKGLGITEAINTVGTLPRPGASTVIDW